jgi:anti-sigma factor RsiW
MNCSRTSTQTDDYLDGELAEGQARLLEQHIAACASCRNLVDEQRALKARLQDYGKFTAAKADPAFFDRALLRAVQSGAKRQRRRWIMTGFGGAMAAVLAVLVVGGTFFNAAEIAAPSVPAVTMALEEPRTVNLVFSSAVALANASMTVTLPDGIEIDGFAGQREITWMTSLKAGKNILPLTLIATSPRGGELLATLRHENDDRSFRVQVTVI